MTPQRDRLSSVVTLCSCSSESGCDSNAMSGRMARAAAMWTRLSGLCLASSRSSIAAHRSRRSRCSSWCCARCGEVDAPLQEPNHLKPPRPPERRQASELRRDPGVMTPKWSSSAQPRQSQDLHSGGVKVS
jgi:hypothetical protein